VVAGDHSDVDASPERGLHRRLGLGAQRIDDADDADEGQVLGQRHRVVLHRRLVALGQDLRRERQHPEALLAHSFVGRINVRTRVRDGHL